MEMYSIQVYNSYFVCGCHGRSWPCVGPGMIHHLSSVSITRVTRHIDTIHMSEDEICPMTMVPALCINRVTKHTKHACARAHTNLLHPYIHSPNNSCISEVCVAILPSSSSSPSLSFSFSPSQMKWAG